MKNLPHIISKLFYGAHLITPAQHSAYLYTVESHLAASLHRADSQPSAPKPAPAAAPDDTDDEPQTKGSTVIIPVHGTLVMHPEDIAMSECGCAMEDLNAAIDAAENDPRIERVIYDFRSPGGTVTGIPETGRKILHSRKDTIGFFDSECCSGSAWLAAQCGRLYGTQSGRFGSIGVYCMTLDISKSLENEGVKVNAIFAGKYKLLGASFKPLVDDERAILQKGVDKIYAQFKGAMESHRMVSDEHFGNGLVFDGDDAAAIGFTDGVVESMDEILENMV